MRGTCITHSRRVKAPAPRETKSADVPCFDPFHTFPPSMLTDRTSNEVMRVLMPMTEDFQKKVTITQVLTKDDFHLY